VWDRARATSRLKHHSDSVADPAFSPDGHCRGAGDLADTKKKPQTPVDDGSGSGSGNAQSANPAVSETAMDVLSLTQMGLPIGQGVPDRRALH
jgi:hypothetical protein